MSDGFGFERLDVYRTAIEFVALAVTIIDELPSGNAVLRDQLRRAAFSIPLSIAEGSGRSGTRDIRKHRTIARGSALECAAIIDVCRILKVSDPARLSTGRDLLLRIVQMLTKMCR